MYAPYIDVTRDDYITDICSPGSYGLKYSILQLDKAALGASFPKKEMGYVFGNLINIFPVCSKKN